MAEEAVCPKCWRPYEERDIIGKTQRIKAGIRTSYLVVRCPCGNVFRGKKVEERKLQGRK
jgi:hypothetical protein